MPLITSDPIGRTHLVTGNLFAGNLGAAARAAISPLSLSAEESKTIVERMGLNNSPWAVVFNTITNPLVLLGAVLNYRFPVARAADMRGVSKTVAKAMKNPMVPPWALEGLAPVSRFADKPEIPEAIMDIGRLKHNWFLRQRDHVVQAMTKYTAKTGRELSEREAFLITAHLDGLVDEAPKALKGWKGPDGKSLRTPLDVAKVRAAMTPELHETVKDMRGMLDNIYDDVVVRSPEMKAELSAAMSKKGHRLGEKGLAQLEAGTLEIPADVRSLLKESDKFKTLQTKLMKQGFLTPGQKLDDYWPHIMGRGLEDHQAFVDALLENSKARESVFGKMASAGIDARVADNLEKRLGRMLPNPEDFERFGEFLHPEKWGAYQQTVGRAMQEGAKGGEGVYTYSMRLTDTLNTYLHRMSSTYAFNATGAGRRLAEGVDNLRASGDTYRASLLQSTIIPMATGRPTFSEATQMGWAAGMRDRTVQMLEGQLGKAIPKDVSKWMLDRVKAETGPLTPGALEGGLVDLMHTAALGLPNIGAPILNTTQTVLMTGPYIGFGNAATGLVNTLKKVPKYIAERSGGKTHAEAFEALWPEFIESGYGQASRIAEGLHETLAQAYSKTKNKGTLKEKVTDGLMWLFTRTEELNQLTAWEGAMHKATREGMKRPEAMNFARHVVAVTQFPSEVANIPMWISRLRQYPGGRLATMFGQFSMRAAGFYASTATTAGSAVQAGGLSGRNWGTLGRAMLASGLIYEAGRALNVDTSRATMFGALPGPRNEYEPFYPLPFVSPAVGAAGSFVGDLFSGEGNFEQTRRNLPLLVPGGIGLARLTGYVSPEAAQAIGRRYVDYQNVTPDGRYGVYLQKEGAPTLIGFMTPAQLVMQGMGLPGAGEPSKEREAIEWLTKNRNRMLQYKRAYVEGMSKNDATAMQIADEQFRRAYPDIPDGLRRLVGQDEIKAMQLRRDVTRMERVFETLPKESRGMFASAMQQAVLTEGSNFLGVPGASLGSGTINSRRSFAAGNGTYGPLPNVGGQ